MKRKSVDGFDNLDSTGNFDFEEENGQIFGECDEDHEEEFEDDNLSDNDDASQPGGFRRFVRQIKQPKRQEEDEIVKQIERGKRH